MVHGCSFGAFHAVNIAFRHPHLFGRVLALSGKYDMTNFFGGYYDDNIYFNSPNHFVPNLSDPAVLDALRRQEYDVILMDAQMPEMDGEQAARIIIERYTSDKRPRLVAVTANALESDRERFLSMGFDDYVSKPIQVEELTRVLQSTKSLPRKTTRPLRMPNPSTSQGD
jgi:CheY-like chemotaxis protein